jgi:copper chaperone CopZ
VRSALLAVKGVSRAQVVLEGREAIVTYDPRETTVQQLIEAVNQAQGPSESIKYHAAIKPSPPP